MNWETESSEVQDLKSHFDHLTRSLSSTKKECSTLEVEASYVRQAQEILQHLAQSVQQQVHAKIAHTVSSCLELVFGEEAYQFHIEFERKRGRTEASFRFRKGDLDLDPLSSSGGGMIDVAAFALRIACLMLHRPRLRRILILDEPFKFVSSEYRDNVRSMIEGLSKDLSLQIILVTHDTAYQTGKVHQL